MLPPDPNYQDKSGNFLSSYQLINGGVQYVNPNINYYLVDGARHPLFTDSPDFPSYRPLRDSLAPKNTPTPIPPQFQFTFDTIGQVIFRSIGHARLPLRPIWMQGINESDDTSVASTKTIAFAICAPIDPLEEGEIFAIWDGGSEVFSTGGVVTPAGWTPEDAALLAASIAGVVIYPGDEAQLPASLIVADKGADKTNAFRGIRYIIFPDYPIRNGASGNGVPQLSLGWQRNNDGGERAETSGGAVEFSAGSL